jgi:pyridoxamine 5'-phosphate oxidase-like protein
MTMLDELPLHIVELLRSSSVAQYVTVSGAGVPIDTPVLVFPSEGLRSFDLATGLSYPAKAERARRNPNVALLIEGGPDEPVVSIAGKAAVRDSNLQANVDRYLSEAAYTLPHNPDWALARQAVWYWSRIIIEITPTRLFWWDSPAAMDHQPLRWDAPAGTLYPHSDPAPPGAPSEPAKWSTPPWRELAQQALGRNGIGHISLMDSDGFPACIRPLSVALTDEGFQLVLPKGMPWQTIGKASLTFNGIEGFVGELISESLMRVDRALPVFPMTIDMTQLWEPVSHTRSELMKRLEHETSRRNQAIPVIPVDRPPPTEGYRRRMNKLGISPPAID